MTDPTPTPVEAQAEARTPAPVKVGAIVLTRHGEPALSRRVKLTAQGYYGMK